MWTTNRNSLNDSIQPDMKLIRTPNTVITLKYCIAQIFEC